MSVHTGMWVFTGQKRTADPSAAVTGSCEMLTVLLPTPPGLHPLFLRQGLIRLLREP